MDTKQLIKIIIQALEDKKANDIKVIDITNISILGDYFVIADAENITHVKSLVDEVEYRTKHEGGQAKRIEKDASSQWIILDYGTVIVHIFYKKAREFYNLERLWADGKVLSSEDFLN